MQYQNLLTHTERLDLAVTGIAFTGIASLGVHTCAVVWAVVQIFKPAFVYV